MKFLVLSLVVTVLACLGSAQMGPPTVDDLEVPKYLGRWYQTHGSPSVLATEVRNGFCVTADYGVYNATTITVRNRQRVTSPTGRERGIDGFAYTTDEAGKLLVDFGFGSYGNYWVLRLGPPTDYGLDELLYAYSVVSEPSMTNLYLLARDTQEFADEYEDEVISWLYDIGYRNTTDNNPLPVYQGDDCIYADLPADDL